MNFQTFTASPRTIYTMEVLRNGCLWRRVTAFYGAAEIRGSAEKLFFLFFACLFCWKLTEVI